MSGPLRIALVLPALDPPEAALQIDIAQARALGRLGAEVHLFVDGEADGRVTLSDLAFLHRRPAPRWLKRSKQLGAPAPEAWHLLKAAKEIQPSLIHLFHFLDTASLARAALMRCRIFAEYNGGEPPRGQIRRRLSYDATAGIGGLFFTAVDQARPFIDAGAIAPWTPIHAVPEISTAIEPTADCAAQRAALRRGDPEVLVVARIEAPKDPRTALEAFRRIHQARPRAHLRWAAAGGAELPSLNAALAAEPALAGRVDLVINASAKEMREFYQTADVMIHPSRREVCGMAFVEALAMGLPIAASDIPPFRAMADPNGAVRFCPLGDAHAFADAALALAEFSGDARLAVREHFERQISFDAIARRKMDAYRL